MDRERDVLSIILGGGRGTRLLPLTQFRSKPAVPIAGKYRLIDIPVSNCLNSGINRIFVLTQFLSVSLNRHISNTYKFDPFGKGFVDILAAQQTNETSDWYQGTADAVRQNIRSIQEDPGSEVLILSGDQLYRMDYRDMLETHRRTNADVTIAVLPVRQDQTSGFGLVRLNDAGRIIGFVEKPKTPEALAPVKVASEWIDKQGVPSKGRNYLASMGIYLFRRKLLVDLLNEPPLAHDFGNEIFPRSIDRLNVQAHLFDGYWEDVGTVKSYHEANLALCDPDPPFDFFHPDGLIYTRMRYLPPSRMEDARLERALISDGCVIGAGSAITRSVIGIRTRIGKNVTIKNSIVIGADKFDMPDDLAANAKKGDPNIGIGDGSIIENAIIDKDCKIGRNVKITNAAGVRDFRCENYSITDGVIVLPKGQVIPDGTVI